MSTLWLVQFEFKVHFNCSFTSMIAAPPLPRAPALRSVLLVVGACTRYVVIPSIVKFIWLFCSVCFPSKADVGIVFAHAAALLLHDQA